MIQFLFHFPFPLWVWDLHIYVICIFICYSNEFSVILIICMEYDNVQSPAHILGAHR